MRNALLEVLSHPELNLEIEIEIAASQISLYLSELRKWNRKINLIAETDERSIIARHIFDSLQYSRAVSRGSRILDIGSGAGFPGIPLKIIFPEIEMVLVESRRKRASFLSSTVFKLGLEKIQIFNGRAEELWQRETFAGKFDHVLFRAVSSVLDCLKLGAPFLNDKGTIIIKKEPGGSGASLKTDSLSIKLTQRLPMVNSEGKKSELLVFSQCST